MFEKPNMQCPSIQKVFVTIAIPGSDHRGTYSDQKKGALTVVVRPQGGTYSYQKTGALTVVVRPRWHLQRLEDRDTHSDRPYVHIRLWGHQVPLNIFGAKWVIYYRIKENGGVWGGWRGWDLPPTHHETVLSHEFPEY